MLLVEQLLLLAAITALSAAGWRLAGWFVPAGLLRVTAAAVLVISGAVGSAIVLGIVALGASPVALTAAAVLAWAVVARFVDRAGPPVDKQLGSWWAGQSAAGRAGRFALVGVFIVYCVWLLRYPVIGLDGLTDHLALAVDWVGNGRPGSIVNVNTALPIANYPVTFEVLVAWVTGVARTLVPQMLLVPGMLALLGVAVRAGLAELKVSDSVSWLATGAMVTLPIAIAQLPGPDTDVPAVALLACSAAMVAAVRTHGRALVVATLAAALAVGIKTTPAPPAVLVLAIGIWWARGTLRPLARPLTVAVIWGAICGGVWYVRNLFDHGSPFWPLSSTPWGDPIPPAFRAVHASLLSSLGPTLRGRVGDYGRALAGGAVVVLGAVSSPLWTRSRAFGWAALAVAILVLIWAAAPYTGISSSTALAVGATRYVLPCLLAAIVAVALAARVARTLAIGVLVATVLVNLDRDATLGFPLMPSNRSLVIGAVVAAALGLAAHALAGATLPRVPTTAAIAVLAFVCSLAALLAPVDGFMRGHDRAGLYDAGLMRWLGSRSAFEHGHQPVAVGPVEVAVLTGTRLTHHVSLLSPSEPCSGIRRSAANGWIVVQVGPGTAATDGHWLQCLDGDRPAYQSSIWVVYAPPRLALGG
jgi:hypothetical protein